MKTILKKQNKPPFYATIRLNSFEHENAGQYMDAIATLTSKALLTSGFVGFDSDVSDRTGNFKTVYFESFNTLQKWIKETKELLPYSININDMIDFKGCFWPWLRKGGNIKKRHDLLKSA